MIELRKLIACLLRDVSSLGRAHAGTQSLVRMVSAGRKAMVPSYERNQRAAMAGVSWLRLSNHCVPVQDQGMLFLFACENTCTHTIAPHCAATEGPPKGVSAQDDPTSSPLHGTYDDVHGISKELQVMNSAPSQILDKDFTLPIGKAKVMRKGKDMTLISFSKMVGHCLTVADAVAKEGIDCEV